MQEPGRRSGHRAGETGQPPTRGEFPATADEGALVVWTGRPSPSTGEASRPPRSQLYATRCEAHIPGEMYAPAGGTTEAPRIVGEGEWCQGCPHGGEFRRGLRGHGA